MHKEILTIEQIELLPVLKLFKKDFYLVGGTSIAFHLGHRRSIDFDMFYFKELKNSFIKQRLLRQIKIDKIIVDRRGELTIIVNSVKITFFNFLYEMPIDEKFENIFLMPDLLTLGAMKAFALGQRAKWKDYVDLYFIFNKYSYQEVVNKAKKLFGNEFNEKLLKVQLSYFTDIDYREKVDWLPGFEVDDNEVKKYLTEVSLLRDY